MDYSEKPLRSASRNRDEYSELEPERERRLGGRRERDDGEGGELGSLAQSARGKKLNQARIILFFVGILTIGVNIFAYFQIQSEIAQARQLGLIINESLVRVAYAATFVAIGLGGLFLVFGLLVKQYPVPITITSLVLYIVANLAFGILSPENLYKGAIIKIAIIVCLAQSIQAAFAYQREEDQTTRMREANSGNEW